MTLTPRQIEEILAKKPEKRYNYFVKTVAQTEEVWGLVDAENGWLMLEDDEDAEASQIIAIFPNREFAEHFYEKGDFEEGLKAEPIDLYEFMEWLEDFEQEGILTGVFPTPNFECAVMPPARLLQDLNDEIEKQDGEEDAE